MNRKHSPSTSEQLSLRFVRRLTENHPIARKVDARKKKGGTGVPPLALPETRSVDDCNRRLLHEVATVVRQHIRSANHERSVGERLHRKTHHRQTEVRLGQARAEARRAKHVRRVRLVAQRMEGSARRPDEPESQPAVGERRVDVRDVLREIGRASCRERV